MPPKSSIAIKQLCNMARERLANVKPDAISAFAAEMHFSSADVNELWSAIDLFLHALPILNIHHANLTAAENAVMRKTAWPAEIKLEPLGHVLVCIPANAAIPLAAIVPLALLAGGNSVTIAASRESRSSALKILEALKDLGTFNVWEGGIRDAVEAHLASEKKVNAIYFIGSSRLYADVAAKCAANGITLIFEGEGRGVAVLDDTLDELSIKNAARDIVKAKTFCNGKMCSSPQIVLVHETIVSHAVQAFRIECKTSGLNQSVKTAVGEQIWKTVKAYVGDLGDPYPALRGGESIHPFFWETKSDYVNLHGELFCPGFVVAKYDNEILTNNQALLSGFNLQVTLFTRDHVRVKVLIEKSNFARYCVNMNPCLQDPILPWGNYGKSGFSDVVDFYKKGLRRVVVEGATHLK